MKPVYVDFEEKYWDTVIGFYMDYYNSKGGKWTYDIARKRLHQIVTMEDSLVMLQFDRDQLVGFLMGYFKHFDDSTGFFLEEILVSADCQNKGYGTDFLSHLKAELIGRSCGWIELLTTTGAMHQNFYRKNGYTQSKNLVLEYLDLN